MSNTQQKSGISRFLLLGATGKLGKVILQQAMKQEFTVVALVRSPEKLSFTDERLTLRVGDVTNPTDLERSLSGCEAVISTLGHGFRTNLPIQEKTFTALLPLMKKQKVRRLVTVTGAGLILPGDPPSVIASVSKRILPFIDPYRLSDAQKQQELLEQSDLSWTVVRTPVHSTGEYRPVRSVGFTQPYPWQMIPRETVARFMLDCLSDETWSRQSPIIT